MKILTILLFVLVGCSSEEKARVEIHGETMGTTYTVKIHKPFATVNKEQLKTQIDGLLKDINQKFSTYIKDSEISKLNRTETTSWIDISSDMEQLLVRAKRVHEFSRGAYDITVMPLVDLWGFGPKGRVDKSPSEKALKNVMSYSKISYLQVKKKQLQKLNPKVQFDLSSIAKGFAVDQISQFLTGQQHQHHMVEIGGEVKASGTKDDGSLWMIGIETPKSHENSVHRTIGLKNLGMATSGSYRNYFESNGKRYSHTIDPRTGKPIEHKLVSVTVIHHEAMMADAWATALMVLGPADGALVAKENGLMAYFMINAGNKFQVFETELFKQQFQ